MSREIQIGEEDLMTLQKCLNEGVEPPQELAKKLFPSLYAAYDFKSLKNSKIPKIEYQGKRSEAAILNEASSFGGGSPLQLERSFDGGKINRDATQLGLFSESGADADSNWQNLIVQGDNLQFLKTCYLNHDPIIKDKVKGRVKLVYIDPPFATRSDFAAKDGEDSYADRVDRAEFIEQLRERLIFMREILADDGTIYVHLDLKMSHFKKIVMDEVFDGGNFLNEIVWRRTYAHSDASRFGQVHDSLLMYRKSSRNIFNKQYRDHTESYIKSHYGQTDKNGRRYRLVTLSAAGPGPSRRFGDKILDPPKGRHWAWSQEKIDEGIEIGKIVFAKTGQPNIRQYLDEIEGTVVQSIWDDIPPVNPISPELLGYPTQKPEALLKRIILASSNPGDLVMDVFAGSGTTAAVAEKLGRRWIMCDFGKHAIYTMQKRMCLIADSQRLGTKSKKKEKYGRPPKPFCVVSVGAFDFGKIMNLRENRDAYITFVMGIFGLTERDESLAKKYRISNVCALKDGNPVEVYPVWEDEYLKNVRVDEDYLKGILEQSGGKLKGDYYIIAPETCVRIGETQKKNAKGEKVTFKMLTFPYKVLEEVARHFSIEEQPSSPESINKLICSVGFYFNEEVGIAVRKTAKGFRIGRFASSILNREERLYEGLDGLAMILVDSDYDEERGFTVDSVIYQKDIKNDEVTASGVTKKSAVIAIDKHGNESDITLIK